MSVLFFMVGDYAWHRQKRVGNCFQGIPKRVGDYGVMSPERVGDYLSECL